MSAKQLAQTLKEASSASAHLVSLVMEGVTEMDAQVGNHNYGMANQKVQLHGNPYQAFRHILIGYSC